MHTNDHLLCALCCFIIHSEQMQHQEKFEQKNRCIPNREANRECRTKKTEIFPCVPMLELNFEIRSLALHRLTAILELSVESFFLNCCCIFNACGFLEYPFDFNTIETGRSGRPIVMPTNTILTLWDGPTLKHIKKERERESILTVWHVQMYISALIWITSIDIDRNGQFTFITCHCWLVV